MGSPDIQTFTLDGLSCASCVSKAEKALTAVTGVESAAVNLADRSAAVTGNASAEDLVLAISAVGFRAAPVIASGSYHFSVPGISCAGCVTKIEKALIKVAGVTDARVNLAEKSVVVEGQADIKELLGALCSVGKPGTLIDSEQQNREKQEQADKTQYRYLIKHSAIALIFSIPLMIHMFVDSMSINSLWDQMIWGSVGLFTLGILYFSGGHYFKGMWQTLKHGSANMDTLIALGTGTAWLYSTIVVIFPHWFPESARYVYFEASAMIIGLINLGHAMELRARGKTSEAIKRLLGLQVKMARVIRNSEEIDIPVEAVQIGDFVRVRPGEKVPVDGVVSEGSSFIDESMLTGEPMAVSKQPGDRISTGTLNKKGTLVFQAEKIGKDTVLAHIIDRVKEAQNSKMPIARLADKISSVFVPVVISIAIVAALIWFFVGPEPRIAHSMIVATTILIIACPCALGLATPMSVMVGVGKAAEFGILVRNGEALQKASGLTTVVLDKTGTITQGTPAVTDIFTAPGYSEDKLLTYAASLESGSEHPLADAITLSAKKRQLKLTSVQNFQGITGKGVEGYIADNLLLLGNDKLMNLHKVDIQGFHSKANDLAEQGKTPMFMAVNKQVIGLIAVSDPIRNDSVDAIHRLHKLGIKVAMLTGDNFKTAQAVARLTGIDTFKAEVLPEDKDAYILELQNQGEVVGMTGDGINDAPALARANVGFAIGTGTDIAIESAEITLMRASLHGLADTVELSKATMNNIKQNLLGAFIYNMLGIPVAAGALYPVLGILLNPIIAGAAMAMSSITVVSNANRLRMFKTSTINSDG